MGALLAKSWHLPATFIAAIRFNQRPERAPEEHAKLVALIHVARILSQGCGFAAKHEKYVPPIHPEMMELLGLSSVDLSAAINEFFDEQEEIALYESIYSSQLGQL